jgi:trigger factor
MVLKTKTNPTAITYILSVMENDIDKLEKRKSEIWEARKGEIVLKGFRKGHVPQSHAESIIGHDNLYEDVIREILNEGIKANVEKVVGVGQVSIDVFGSKQPVVLRAEVWLEPKVNLVEDKYKSLKVELDPITVSDSEVEAVLQRMREASATIEPVDREAEKGDVVSISFDGKLEDGSGFSGNSVKEFKLVIGSGSLLPDFEAQLIGTKAGEVRLVNIVFPTSWNREGLAGNKAIFTTTIHDVKKRTLPDVNNDFAKNQGYADLVDAHNRLHEELLLNKQQQSKATIEQQLLINLVTNVSTDPIPKCMITTQVNTIISNLLRNLGLTKEEYLKKAKTTEEDLIAQYEQAAHTDVRARLILGAIANAEKIEVTETEYEEALKNLQAGTELTLEDVKGRVDLNVISNNIKIQKAMEVVHKSAVIQNKTLPLTTEVVDPAIQERRAVETASTQSNE